VRSTEAGKPRGCPPAARSGASAPSRLPHILLGACFRNLSCARFRQRAHASARSPHYTSVSSTRVSSAKRARKRSANGWAFWDSGVGADATAVHQASSSHYLQPSASSPAARRKVLCQGPLGITRGLELSQPKRRAVPRRVEVLYEHRGQAFTPRGFRRRACHTGSACGRVEDRGCCLRSDGRDEPSKMNAGTGA
jgi:hypothetical protein